MADTPQHEQGKIETKSDLTSDLPAVESPSISPAVTEPVAEPQPAVDAEPIVIHAISTEVAPAEAPHAPTASSEAAVLETANVPRFRFSAHHKRYAMLAASVVFAAALGAVVGVAASGGLAAFKQTELAYVEDSKATQQTIARLSKEIAALKANVEAANKSAHTLIVQNGGRVSRENAEITGSISAPQTVLALPRLPVPRPATRVSAVETQMPSRSPVLADWIIRDVRDGYVYVQGHGDIYQVALGAPLPGLGPVEQVKRQEGRWMVVTPKGIIVSLRDRRYFE